MERRFSAARAREHIVEVARADVQAYRPPDPATFVTGHECTAVYDGDGKWYDATVESADETHVTLRPSTAQLMLRCADRRAPPEHA